jgi:hypothetical protein
MAAAGKAGEDQNENENEEEKDRERRTEVSPDKRNRDFDERHYDS